MAKLTRRQALKTAGASAAALALGAAPALRAAADDPKANFPYTLPKLPYAYDALVPHIDKQTMQIHHDRHHQAYVDGLNAALKGHDELQKMTLDNILRNINKVPMAIRQSVINMGGGHYNHSMFWEIMSPKGGKPAGALADAIDKAFTSFDGFKKQLSQAALTRFGSGWGWLVVDKGRLAIISTANQDCPLMEGKTPILGLDVWEHAYYLHYQNRRGDYINAWWNVVNWPAVGQRYAAAMKRNG